jgi:hypothetical protein
MKITKKLLSLLLVTVLVAGMLTTFASASTLPNIGMSGSIGGMPSNAENIQYLSDLYSTHVVDQLNKTVTLDTGYHNYVMAFVNGARYQIGGDKVDANGNRTVDGVTFNKDDIALGYNGTKFEKGLGVHPDALGNPDRYIVYDVSKLNVNRFYAVVGGTGTNITHPTNKDHYLEFELLGSKSATYDANSFETLALAKDIRSYLVAEFDVDITGYNFIKLVVRIGANSLNNQSCGGVWGGACVYTGTKPAGHSMGDAAQPDAFTTSTDGTYVGIPSEHQSNSAFLSDFGMVSSSNNSGNPSTLNTPYGAPDDTITIGELNTMFWSGVGMHPKKGGEGESYTIFDVSDLNADRFYSVVGITNTNGKNGAGNGVLFGVYGDYGDGNYVLLAQSGLITNYGSGEFDVDITGVKNLKLAVLCGGTNNASSGCAWGDATLYSTTGNLNLPTEPPTEPSEEPTTKPTTKPTTSTTPTTTPVEEPASEFPIGIVIGIAAAVVVAVAAVVVIIIIKKKKAN